MPRATFLSQSRKSLERKYEPLNYILEIVNEICNERVPSSEQFVIVLNFYVHTQKLRIANTIIIIYLINHLSEETYLEFSGR